MPFGYLATVALIALCTALALAPVPRTRILAAASFRLTVLINEQPFLAFLALAASSLLRLRRATSTRPAVGRCSVRRH
jgi:hypothetical protein